MSVARRYDPSPARARAIRQAREWAHMSERDLARALGYRSRTPVRAWEACVLDPGPAVIARIAEVTRVPVSSLLVPSRGWDGEAAGWPVSRTEAA